MTTLAALQLPVIVLLTVTFFLLSAMQVVHTISVIMRDPYSTDRFDVFYEITLVIHLLISCSLVLSFAYSHGAPYVEFGNLQVPLEAAMWWNLLCSAFGFVAGYREESAAVVPEVILLFFLTPTLAMIVGQAWPFFVVADAVYFLFREVYVLIDDRDQGNNVPHRTSLIESLDLLPEGVLYIGKDGRAVFMNDAMRSCLHALDLPLDLADARNIWPSLLRICQSGLAPSGMLPAGLRIEISPGETRFFTLTQAELGDKIYDCLIAYDITEEDHLRREVEEANRELERTSTELAASLENIQSIADNDALLNMRSRVHDVIGQRLSILHRYLEDDQLSDETVAKIKPLLTSMLAELEGEATDEQSANFDEVVNAFSVIGIEYEVTGHMPRNAKVEQLFTRITREASTNAVRHAGASRIKVELGQRGGRATLRISNDGTPTGGPVAEGSGIRGMRRSVAELHGSLEIHTTPAFTIYVEVPL